MRGINAQTYRSLRLKFRILDVMIIILWPGLAEIGPDLVEGETA